MKPIWFAGTVVAALAIPAMTGGPADRPYTKGPVRAVYNWTGLYIGGTVGGGWQRSRTDYASDPSYHLGSIIFIPALDFGVLARSTSQNGAGVLGGMTLGYNWQRDAVVFGVEGDWSWTGLK